MNWISSKKRVPRHTNRVLVKYAGSIRFAVHHLKDSTFRFENGSFVSLKLIDVQWSENPKKEPSFAPDVNTEIPEAATH